MRQHRHHEVGKIDAVAALRCFMVQCATGANIIAHIRNRDDRVKTPCVGVCSCPDGIIKVARIARIDGDDGQMAQILPMVVGDRQLSHAFSLTLGGFGHFKWNTELVNGNQAEAFRRKWVAEDLSHPRRFFMRIACQFGEHQFPSLGITNVTNLRIKARFLVDRL